MKKLVLPLATLGAAFLCRPASAATKQNLTSNRRRILAALLAAITVAAGLLSLAPPARAQTYRWTTLAGMPGGQGSSDGTGSAARFNFPHGVAVDGNGNVYVADTENSTIRKVTPSGMVTTLAGSAGMFGNVDGTGSAARFNAPVGVAVDGNGNVFVADSSNETIRKVTPAGVVTTLAGSAGMPGSTDGTGNAARFNFPNSVAVDGNGNVYVADSSNDTIRKVTSTGVVTTVAGSPGVTGSADGTGSAARFNFPEGIAVDGNGNLYVSDTENFTLRKVTSAGVVTTLAGSPGLSGSTDGTGSAARFTSPDGAAVDGTGNVYVIDNDTVRKVTSAGVVTTLAGSAGMFANVDGTGSAARFFNPVGVAVAQNGNLYVGDNANHEIRKVTSAGVVTTLAGSAGFPGSTDGTGSAARFNNPDGAAVDGNGNIFVADTLNDTIRKITPAGVVTTLAGSPGNAGSADGTGSAARFNQPRGIALDSSGNLYVSDFNNATIRKITAGGAVTTLAGNPGNSGYANGTGSAALFDEPWGVAVDTSGNIYVGDSNNEVVRKITPGGVVSTLAGTAFNAGYADGAGTAARFNTPAGVAVDMSGNVFVADADNGVIRKITPAGVVTTPAGNPNFSGSADGTGNAAEFDFPEGVAVDGNGNVYVADTFNHTIRKVTSADVVTTIGGQAGTIGGSDGPGKAALFYYPAGIAATPGGVLFVADTNNNRVVRGTAAFNSDFNGDGYPDYLLFDASTLQTELWHLKGSAFLNQSFGPTLPSGWALVNAADFNGDGKPDYLIYNASTRQTAIWYMNDTVHLGGVYGPTLSAGWTIAAVADFNGDGSPDYLLYNATYRQTQIWYLNDTVYVSSAFGPTLPTGWTLAGVADFNGDGQPDWLLFNASTRQTAIWYMNGATHTGGVNGPTAPAGWTVVGVADFNADGQPDLVLFDASTLQTAIWYLNGATPTREVYAPTLPTGWQLVAP